ncbi:MAG: hypothetical protein RI907_354 [Pseudomonadota bacterium]|jgi:predicted metal-dependent hydrolase
MTTSHPIIPREKLDFDLAAEDIPKFWFDGDPFKTRFFDAMSTLFPEGERFFILCVRDYRDQITDPRLLQDIKDFIRQEAQHSLVHGQFNDRLQKQGIPVDKLEKGLRFIFDKFARKLAPKATTLADTAATEHLTAIMAHSFFVSKDMMSGADPRIRALFAWHAMEEIEHKSVAHEVLTKIAKVGYLRRVASLLSVTVGFNFYTFFVALYMLSRDKLGVWQTTKAVVKGLWWLYKPGGLYLSSMGHYLEYFKFNFDPWQSGEMVLYKHWRDAFDASGDPVQAGERMYAALG